MYINSIKAVNTVSNTDSHKFSVISEKHGTIYLHTQRRINTFGRTSSFHSIVHICWASDHFSNLSNQVCSIKWIYAHVTKKRYLCYHLLIPKGIHLTGMYCYLTFPSIDVNQIISQIKCLLHTPPYPSLEEKNTLDFNHKGAGKGREEAFQKSEQL